jgi:hypothetical protein
MTTLRQLTRKQKSQVGPKVTVLVQAKRPDDAVAGGLCNDVDASSKALTTAKRKGRTAKQTRKVKAGKVERADLSRDRAAKAINAGLKSWELRDDEPEIQAAAQTLRRHMLSEGMGFVNFANEEESDEIWEMLDLRTDPEVGAEITAAIGQIPAFAGFITNLENQQQKFDGISTEKQQAHVISKEQTQARKRAESKWENSLEALLKYLAGKYDDEAGQAVLQELLQPLNEALALAQRRETLRRAGQDVEDEDEDGEDEDGEDEDIDASVTPPIEESPPSESPSPSEPDPEGREPS